MTKKFNDTMEYISKLQERNKSILEDVQNLQIMEQELEGLDTEYKQLETNIEQLKK